MAPAALSAGPAVKYAVLLDSLPWLLARASLLLTNTNALNLQLSSKRKAVKNTSKSFVKLKGDELNSIGNLPGTIVNCRLVESDTEGRCRINRVGFPA